MRFALTDDQAALRDAVRDLLSRECKPAVVREAWAGGAGAYRVVMRSSPPWGMASRALMHRLRIALSS